MIGKACLAKFNGTVFANFRIEMSNECKYLSDPENIRQLCVRKTFWASWTWPTTKQTNTNAARRNKAESEVNFVVACISQSTSSKGNFQVLITNSTTLSSFWKTLNLISPGKSLRRVEYFLAGLFLYPVVQIIAPLWEKTNWKLCVGGLA